ncbi:MAG: hypothetical protein ACXADL_08030 [Candidatus Thorarchaeota archaeon]
MFKLNDRTGLELPAKVAPSSLMQLLEIGHGYRWTIITRNPALLAHGLPATSNMPELLIVGKRTLIISGGNAVYVERIERILDILSRRSQNVSLSAGGISYG